MGFYIKTKFVTRKDLFRKFKGEVTEWPFGDETLNNYPISLFIDYIPTADELKINPYNILMIVEPEEYFGLHTFAVNNAHHFTCVLTWSSMILDNCENSVLFPDGMSWLKMPYIEEMATKKKTFEVSYLCGALKKIEGHFIRHKLYERESEVTMPKKWFFTLPDYINVDGTHKRTDIDAKRVCWDESMFHIAIENVSRKNCYSEKILDAFLTKTIPIYYGCTNIDDFFNSDGIFTFKTEQEAIDICNSLTEEDYHSRIDAVNENYEIAKGLFYWEEMIHDWIWDFIKDNNIQIGA